MQSAKPFHRKRSPFSSRNRNPFVCVADISPDRGISFQGRQQNCGEQGSGFYPTQLVLTVGQMPPTKCSRRDGIPTLRRQPCLLQKSLHLILHCELCIEARPQSWAGRSEAPRGNRKSEETNTSAPVRNTFKLLPPQAVPHTLVLPKIHYGLGRL